MTNLRALPRLAMAAALILTAAPGRADEALPSGDEVVARVNARDDGQQVSRKLVMELIDKRGNVRTRETRSFRKYYGEEKRSVLFYESPKNVKDTAFLTFDHPGVDRDDDQWLYLPALRKTRRISGADRGGAFLGTDFSYEDIKKETRIGVLDYTRKTLRRESLDGRPCIVVEHTPVDADTARELGYGRVLTWIDGELWIVRKAEYWDERGKALKSVAIEDIRKVDGIWTPHRMEATSHGNGHRSVFTCSEIDYETPVPDDLFSERALRRGL